MKNGVVKETSSEFVPGKGWVNTSPIQPEEESQKSSNEAFEEVSDPPFGACPGRREANP